MALDLLQSKKVSIFGSTGSIGKNTLNIIKNNRDKFTPYILTANCNYKELIAQAREYKPEFIAIANENYYKEIKDSLSDIPVKIFAGIEGLNQLAELNVDIVISAITGIAGLSPTLNSIKNTKILALANKESIVCANKFIVSECKKYNTNLIPIDSEHNSIFQLLANDKNIHDIDKITLTASGGPFLFKNYHEFPDIKLSDALKHPNWNMGKKITVDSATMVNKALEIIEANYLFPDFSNKFDIIMHPESIIHALISYKDGAIKSLLAAHDMRVPIAYAMSYPNRLPQQDCKIKLADLPALNFIEPDLNKFRVLKLVENIIFEGKALPIVFNAANEVMVDYFLNEKILFLDIVKNIEIIINNFNNVEVENIEHVYEIDAETRSIANNMR